ncbi:dual specificity protein phosphatase family protein [Sphingosinicella sp. CPCC 101087]|uniref:protein-tyrosine phosphatase family protein n=1 Tax=Sphingosinicella sp. CPCC 101087 TaxID=2497754 RepID=UPI00101DFF67|nr:dual specificity protein phosphatase family protein [Sphingosinicella sp. CPCC 101087]
MSSAQQKDSAIPPWSWRANLDWLTDKLALGGSFPAERTAWLVEGLAIRAVIDLRAEACDDADAVCRHGLGFLHLPTPDHHAVADSMLDRGVAFAARYLDRGERVLIHCEHGIGRAPLLALCVLVDRGRAPLEALHLAKERRPAVSPSPAQYEAWAGWLRRHGHTPPAFDAFAAIAYRHLPRG